MSHRAGTSNGRIPYEHGAIEESLLVKTIDASTGSRTDSGSATGSGEVLTPTAGPGGLISILKGLEIEKSLVDYAPTTLGETPRRRAPRRLSLDR
jgi:hypothetical protein